MNAARTASILAIASLAPKALAAPAEEKAVNPLSLELVPFVATLLAFGIVYFILATKVWPVILNLLQKREEKIRTDIEEAERSRKRAEKSLQEYESALADARNEAAKMLEQARSDQQKLAAELKARTEQEITQMKEAARRDIDAARKAAVSEIYSHMAATATDIAGKIIERELNPDDHQRLVEESLNQLQTAQAN
jgi:F-type H+-transporting ATPase subunit b